MISPFLSFVINYKLKYMMNFILILLGLASSHNNANITMFNNNKDLVAIQSGETGQIPPPKK